ADTVDVYATAGYFTGDDIYFAVAGDTGAVTISGGAMGSDATVVPVDSAIYGYDAQANGMVSAPDDGMWGYIGAIAGADLGPGTMIDEIAWTLVGGATNADIVLVATTDFMAFEVLDTINVPEPMTIALMGLGSLFLLRRRK
nr:PEP-CTERM sorting domain-containing protein [Phycisphaerae bacterium]NIR63385.1 PEP-CTERM sorting domain-containing protein [candidate division Zixibacteria bacterium]NIW44332.1 PEP-CTERM sorting domain-containing protein [Gammaproteobacteria bacterium]NIP55484.1 PEP-CTERM sorting domain-containing protein [Phycisphaerae bacterium]NIS54194.1 PEP-CTERM sorting domain-containing protein [Phycisphaerae bacterium]